LPLDHDDRDRSAAVTRRSSFLIASLCAAASIAAAEGVNAQTRRLTDASDSVPRALAEAVLDPLGTMRMFAGGQLRLVVGTLPAGLARRLWLPPGSTVLGGLESSGLGLAIIHAPMSGDSLAAAFLREQPKLGWTLPPPRRPTAMMGFVAAPESPSGGDAAGTTFCSGGTTLTIGVKPVDPLTWEIRAMAMDVSSDRCRPTTVRVTQPPNQQYPSLLNPPGSGNGFGVPCGNFSSNGSGGQTRLQTMMTADEVFAHYGKQLADSGWTPTPTQLTARSWTRRDSTGALVEITLRVRSEPASTGCLEVQMDVRSRRPG
jgi:hypothetical protein